MESEWERRAEPTERIAQEENGGRRRRGGAEARRVGRRGGCRVGPSGGGSRERRHEPHERGAEEGGRLGARCRVPGFTNSNSSKVFSRSLWMAQAHPAFTFLLYPTLYRSPCVVPLRLARSPPGRRRRRRHVRAPLSEPFRGFRRPCVPRMDPQVSVLALCVQVSLAPARTGETNNCTMHDARAGGRLVRGERRRLSAAPYRRAARC